MSKVPPYLRVYTTVVVKKPDNGELVQFCFEIDEIAEDGLLAQVERLVKAFASRGFEAASADDMGEAQRKAEALEASRLAAELAEQQAKGKGYDPKLLDALLRAHKGEAQ